MKTLSLALMSISIIAAASVANATSHMSGMPMSQGGMTSGQGGMPMSQGGKMSAQAHKAQGTVKAVDSAAGKLKLDHGAIDSLKWSAMTMEFAVQDKKLLEGVKPGMRVEFELAQDKSKNYVVTRIRPVN